MTSSSWAIFTTGAFTNRHQFIGQIDDDGAFRYFEGQGNGRQTFPEHIAGNVQGLLFETSLA